MQRRHRRLAFTCDRFGVLPGQFPHPVKIIVATGRVDVAIGAMSENEFGELLRILNSPWMGRPPRRAAGVLQHRGAALTLPLDGYFRTSSMLEKESGLLYGLVHSPVKQGDVVGPAEMDCPRA